jgi:hypothetical protein
MDRPATRAGYRRPVARRGGLDGGDDMRSRFGARYGAFSCDLGCAGRHPLVLALQARLDEGVSRRSVLAGLAAGVAAPAPGARSAAQAGGRRVLLRAPASSTAGPTGCRTDATSSSRARPPPDW